MARTTRAKRLLALAIAIAALAAAAPTAAYAGPVPLCGSGGGPACSS